MRENTSGVNLDLNWLNIWSASTQRMHRLPGDSAEFVESFRCSHREFCGKGSRNARRAGSSSSITRIEVLQSILSLSTINLELSVRSHRLRDFLMWVHASCSLDFNPPVATPFMLMLRPRSGMQQWVAREQYTLSPSVPAVEFTDPFGNLCQRLVAPPGSFSIHTSADIQAADAADSAPGAPFVEVQQLPAETLPFLLPSRFCESDRFTEMATLVTQGYDPGYDQCTAIVRYIRDTLQYRPGTGQQIISAAEVNQNSQAVCRDMAHLGIALCRAIAIPARMVVGYLHTLMPMDLHAWFEAYVGGRWYTFDATQDGLRGARVAIAYGRDAADVAVYTQFGDPVDLVRMDVRVEQLDSPPA